ncbi:MAG: PIG-L family deacetylase [Hyphomonadaceae bacterium]
MKRLLAACLSGLASACAATPAAQVAALPPPPSPPMVSVFTVAHQDDWQLFMNPAAYRAMDEPQEKAVFIHVTAGDAGAGAGGEPVPYYLAREEGALRAVRFMANAAAPAAGQGAKMDSAMVDRGGHGVQRYAYANAVVYFLRLPDGNIVNGKVSTPHPESLTRLRSGDAASSGTVEQSARYEGWDDLLATLGAIVEAERVTGSGLTLHIAELDAKLNPGDHPDHRAVAFAMEEVAKLHPCAPLHRHLEYFTRTKPVNVSGEDYVIDVGTWAATASGLSDNHAKATWEPEHNAWIGRSYSRLQAPSASCPTGGKAAEGG